MPADEQKNFDHLSGLINAEGAINEKSYEKLIQELNLMVENNFEKLLQLLYRVDVSEKNLKEKLKNNPDKDAAVIIADLIIERQQEKQKQRQKSPPTDLSIPEDEKW